MRVRPRKRRVEKRCGPIPQRERPLCAVRFLVRLRPVRHELDVRRRDGSGVFGVRAAEGRQALDGDAIHRGGRALCRGRSGVQASCARQLLGALADRGGAGQTGRGQGRGAALGSHRALRRHLLSRRGRRGSSYHDRDGVGDRGCAQSVSAGKRGVRRSRLDGNGGGLRSVGRLSAGNGGCAASGDGRACGCACGRAGGRMERAVRDRGDARAVAASGAFGRVDALRRGGGGGGVRSEGSRRVAHAVVGVAGGKRLGAGERARSGRAGASLRAASGAGAGCCCIRRFVWNPTRRHRGAVVRERGAELERRK